MRSQGGSPSGCDALRIAAMDAIVAAALKKWPNVPHCYGWLALDARGDWYMRDDRIQAAGPFPRVKGSRIEHDKLRDFIARNYAADGDGAWFFQNGPQRVYVEHEAAPWGKGRAGVDRRGHQPHRARRRAVGRRVRRRARQALPRLRPGARHRPHARHRCRERARRARRLAAAGDRVHGARRALRDPTEPRQRARVADKKKAASRPLSFAARRRYFDAPTM